MNQLPFSQQVRVIALLTEGMSIRGIERLTGTNRNTIMALGKRVGDACHRLHHARMRGLQVGCLELDETWSFVCKKQKNLQEGDPADWGDAYLWVALDAHKKLIISYRIGKRTGEEARTFLADVRGRVINRPQITTDAFRGYEDAVDEAFGGDVDYVMMNKQNGTYPIQRGRPDMTQVTTNHVERVNLTVRMHLRRHARRTSGHSKKLDRHQAAIDLLVAFYNYCRVHETLCVTPAMEFGLTRHIWDIPELMQAAEAAPDPTPLPQPPGYPRPGRRPAPRLYVLPGGKNRKIR